MAAGGGEGDGCACLVCCDPSQITRKISINWFISRYLAATADVYFKIIFNNQFWLLLLLLPPMSINTGFIAQTTATVFIQLSRSIATCVVAFLFFFTSASFFLFFFFFAFAVCCGNKIVLLFSLRVGKLRPKTSKLFTKKKKTYT